MGKKDGMGRRSEGRSGERKRRGRDVPALGGHAEIEGRDRLGLDMNA